jgi:hypothetical protein
VSGPVLLREAHEGQHIGLSLIHQSGKLVQLGKGGDEGRAHTAPAALADMARSFLMKCPQQRRQGRATLVIAALRPSCASEVTTLTPCRPRPASLRSKADRMVLARRNRYPCRAARDGHGC